MGTSKLTWRQESLDGRPVVYGIAGDGLPLLFLHGWGLGYRSYRRSLEHLAAQGSRVYAPALPGFGGTPALASEKFNFAGYAGWVRSFLDTAGVDGPVALVGHSFGGEVAIRFAHDHPDLVRSLVLVNSVGGSAWSHHGSALLTVSGRHTWLLADPVAFAEIMTNVVALGGWRPEEDDGTAA